MSCAVFGTARAAPEQGYVVRLTRPERVGDKYNVFLVGREQSKERTTVAGRLVRDASTGREVVFEGVAEVLAVDSRLQATRTAFVVKRCVSKEKDHATDVLRPGQKVVVEEEGGRTRYSVDGAPASPEVAQVLSAVLVGRKADAPTADDIFGAKERKRVGDEWTINSEAAARDLASVGVRVSPSNISGKTKLLGARKQGGTELLEVRATMALNGFETPSLPGARVERAAADVMFHSLIPADPVKQAPVASRLHMRIGVTLRFTNPQTGEEALTEGEMEHSVETRIEAITP